MTQRNLPWKPVVKLVAFVAAREAGIYLYRLAINRAETDRLKANVRKKLDVLRRDFGWGHKDSPKEDIQNGVDPEGPSPRGKAAQRRVRDENGRFTRKPHNPEGGDTS